jgi:hypothetical protein
MSGSATKGRVVTSRGVEKRCSAFERLPLRERLPRVFSCHASAGFNQRDVVRVVCVESRSLRLHFVECVCKLVDEFLLGVFVAETVDVVVLRVNSRWK